MRLSLPIRIAVHLAVLAEISAGLQDYSAENSGSDEGLRPREKGERGNIPTRSQFVAPDTCLGGETENVTDLAWQLALSTCHLLPDLWLITHKPEVGWSNGKSRTEGVGTRKIPLKALFLF